MDHEFITYDLMLTDSEWMVCIDPGHGGMIGKHYQTSPFKMYDHGDFIFYEGEFNRIIAVMLAEKLRTANISHFFSTTSNYDVSLPIRVTRVNNFAKKYKLKKQLFLSIHANAAPAGAESATGIEVFTNPGDTDADPIATVFFNHLEKMNWRMRKDVSDGDPDKEAPFFVLRYTMVPAVLLELGFYTNRLEAEELLKKEVQEKLVQHLYDAIIEITKMEQHV